ncbi:hypothetical protein NLM24_38690 [Nocardia zapadnayensis]|nr:hypothetical protein [Brevibacterium sp. CS2]MCT1589988.1 hypothetical protein [Kocuria palustris]MCX0276478.1 hypothetical protein [Nocardia zapadnayensis]
MRDTNTGPGGTGIAHCLPEFIPDEAVRVFGVLAKMDHLRGRDRAGLSEGLAWAWGETTAIRPFRDVNTRSQFTLFNQLAVEAGWVLDWNQIDPHVFAHARTVAIYRDPDGLDALLYPALVPAASSPERKVAERMEQVVAKFARPRPPRKMDALDHELHAALQRRAYRLAPDPPFGPPHQGPGLHDRGVGL